MFIKYDPHKDEPQKINTNLGEFVAGQMAGPFFDADATEAQRLITNGGGFVACDQDGKVVKTSTDDADVPAAKKRK